MTNLVREGHTVDEFLFETVGEKYGIGKTLASEYYYDQKKQIDPILEYLGLDISKKK